ncbi:sulfatase [Streptomyces rapamycinicus]|uniref:Sulfatase n=1 Tax=Streptomyces rhizosphaericus TaxID=114699 RepID=A0A6G4ACP0_9ACTN|nr:sulfatase [Streptomyces rhizosphaericus]
MSRQSSSRQRSETDKGTTEEGLTEGPSPEGPEGPPERTPDVPAQAADASADADNSADVDASADADTAADADASAGHDASPEPSGASEEAADPEETTVTGPLVGTAPDAAAVRKGWRAKYPVVARTVAWTVTGLSLALVFLALLLPTKLALVEPSAFMRIPVEGIFGATLLLMLPTMPRRVVAVLAGAALGALTILNLLDIGFNEFLGRGFNVVLDWILLDDAESYLKDSVGDTAATIAVIGVVVLAVALLVLMALAVLRVSNVMARNTAVATRTTLVLGTVWVMCAALGVQVAGAPFASRSTTALVQDRAERVRKTLKDEREFAKVAAVDTYGDTPGDQLLTGLRGKDMMFTFIESYGRSAIEDPAIAPGVDKTLKNATKRLNKAGFASKSGWLTSATYGGSSWLGHSTFLTGLWIDNQNRYRTVTAGDHMSITRAFQRTGAWRTVGIMPGVQKAWPEGKFYGLDHVYDSRELGYKGPKFSWSTMPDQYALKAFEELEHGKKHDKPLMSLNILTSSHQPWAPIPKTIPWSKVGNGSVYKGIEKAGKRPGDVFTNSTKVKQEYGKSIQYSVNSLIDYVLKYGNKNTVLVFLGDHQPLARVSGDNASRDVPVAIVAHDKAVLDRISHWGWDDGLMPGAKAPVWKMSSFRDRFLDAYGPNPGGGTAPASPSASPKATSPSPSVKR